MQRFVLKVDFRDDRGPYKEVIETDGDAWQEALNYVLDSEFDCQCPPDQLAATLSQVRAHGEAPLEVGCYLFAVWCRSAVKFGIGESQDGTVAGTDRRDHVLMTVRPYVPNQQVKEHLEALSKDELVDLLLRVEVEGNLPKLP